MRVICCLAVALIFHIIAGCGPPAAAPSAEPLDDKSVEMNVIEVAGQTQPVPSRLAKISPTVSQPVTKVLVIVGDRVKAGQALIQQEDQKQQMEVRAKRTNLAELQAKLTRLKADEPPLSEVEVKDFEARISIARATFELAQIGLKKYTVTAAINGVIRSLDVSPGQVPEPGTTAWGEIVDLREIDVSCDLTPQQAERVSVGQTGKILHQKRPDDPWTGRVVFVGLSANPKTGQVPVLLRLDNPRERLRSDEKVQVQIAVKSKG